MSHKYWPEREREAEKGGGGGGGGGGNSFAVMLMVIVGSDVDVACFSKNHQQNTHPLRYYQPVLM